jgi:hypothetical protein
MVAHLLDDVRAVDTYHHLRPSFRCEHAEDTRAAADIKDDLAFEEVAVLHDAPIAEHSACY